MISMLRNKKRGYRKNLKIRRVASRGISPLKKAKGVLANRLFFILNMTLVSVIGYFLYFFLLSPYYETKTIVVEGVRFISSSELIEDVQVYTDSYTFLGVKTNNLLLINKRKLESTLGQKYLFSDIIIEKKLPNTLLLSIEERNVIYRIAGTGHEYLVDDQGVVVRRVTNFTQRPTLLSLNPQDPANIDLSYPNIHQEGDQFINFAFVSDTVMGVGQKLFSDKNLLFLKDVVGVSQDKITLEKILFDQPLPQVIRAQTNQGWDILFNTNDSVEAQLRRLDIVLKEQIGERNIPRLEYVDLRLGTSVYYKYK